MTPSTPFKLRPNSGHATSFHVTRRVPPTVATSCHVVPRHTPSSTDGRHVVPRHRRDHQPLLFMKLSSTIIYSVFFGLRNEILSVYSPFSFIVLSTIKSLGSLVRKEFFYSPSILYSGILHSL